ncbi:MAG TPA: hypothetical protein VNT52_00590, partial [Acidimicrobiales bacterium]|nr:hypothetical protein [Acidimicrobiales bacterium]
DGERLRLLLREIFTAAGGTHEDWDTYDRVRAVDIVELDPLSDVAHITTDTAALALLNVAAGLFRRPPQPEP